MNHSGLRRVFTIRNEFTTFSDYSIYDYILYMIIVYMTGDGELCIVVMEALWAILHSADLRIVLRLLASRPNWKSMNKLNVLRVQDVSHKVYCVRCRSSFHF